LRTRLHDAGYVVQTLRCAPTMNGTNSCADLVSVAHGVETMALDAGFDYATLGVVAVIDSTSWRMPWLPRRRSLPV
jgi:hypothetical protein